MMRPATALFAAAALGACSAPDGVARRGGEAAIVGDAAKVERAAMSRKEEMKGTGMAKTEILITTNRGQLRAQLADNDAARALAGLLPLQIKMRDHLRQEKTGLLPSALPDGERKADFSVGTLGLWEDRDFVIYYSDGRVPPPGIVILGQVSGDLSQFDNADGVTVSLRRTD